MHIYCLTRCRGWIPHWSDWRTSSWASIWGATRLCFCQVRRILAHTLIVGVSMSYAMSCHAFCTIKIVSERVRVAFRDRPAMGIYVLWCDCFILLWDIFWYVCRICENFHFANTALHFQLVSPPEVGLLSWDTSGQYRYVGDSSGEFSMKFRAILADDWRKKSRVGEHRIIIVPKALKPMSPLLMQRSNSQFNAPCTYNRKLW